MRNSRFFFNFSFIGEKWGTRNEKWIFFIFCSFLPNFCHFWWFFKVSQCLQHIPLFSRLSCEITTNLLFLARSQNTRKMQPIMRSVLLSLMFMPVCARFWSLILISATLTYEIWIDISNVLQDMRFKSNKFLEVSKSLKNCQAIWKSRAHVLAVLIVLNF